MIRHTRRLEFCWVLATCACVAIFPGACASADCCGGVLIDRATLERIGLTRAWFSQVELDPAYGKVSDWAIAGDELFIATNVGLVHALDVNTGRTLWTARVGNPDYPSIGPTVSENYVAIINGSTTYLLNRETGRIVIEQPLDGAPGAAPVVANKYFYTPLINGRVVGYALNPDDAAFPWHYQSFGRATVSPLATPDGVMWTTDDGHLYASGGERPGIRYRLETAASFTASPKLGKDAVYAISSWGELYALDTVRGSQKWKYATGFPAHRAPAVIGDEIYVTTDEPALHCVDAATGEARWFAPGISQFAAASDAHVYALDREGRLFVLHRQSGARIHRTSAHEGLMAVANDQNDRILVVTTTGLVQCLHEVGAERPKYHIEVPDQPQDAAPPEDEPEAAEVAPDEEESRPAEEDAPIDEFIDAEDDEAVFEEFDTEADEPADGGDDPFDVFGDDESDPF